MTEKPVYRVGDILVLSSFGGRSTHHSFMEVASLTKTGAPRVYFLDTTVEEVFKDITGSKHLIKPIISSRLPQPATAMRWYSARGTFAFEQTYGCQSTSLKLYDRHTIYADEWMSD